MKWDPRIDRPVAAGLSTAWLVNEFIVKKPWAPASCHWCETNAFDTSIRSAFNPGLTPSAQGLAAPDLWSNVIGLGLTPV